MAKFMNLKINNSKNASVKSGKWRDPGAKLYDQLSSAVYIASNICNDPRNKSSEDILKEAYLVAPVNNIKHGVHGENLTPYSKSGFKYPHHVIKGNELVVHEIGLKAAYARAKQMGVFRGEIKEHLERHYKQLGLYKGSTMEIDESIENNFDYIENYISESFDMDMLHDDYFTEKGKFNNLVPVFGIAKSYDDNAYRADGTLKTKEELESIKFQNIVKKITRNDNYSHALISFDDTFRKMYSYGDNGFETDDIMNNDSWLATNSIYISVMFISQEDKEKMFRYINYLMKHKSETKYGTSNILTAYIAKPTKVDKRFICSSFTGYLLYLANPKNIHRDYSRLRPEDVTILPRAFYVANVSDRLDFMKKRNEIRRRVEYIYKENEEELMDYNNHLPRLLLKDKMQKIKFHDKILDYILDNYA